MTLLHPGDRIYVAGHRGMAGSAIGRALRRAGYGDPTRGGALLTAPRQELDLLDPLAVQRWFGQHRPSVVVLAAASGYRGQIAWDPSKPDGTPRKQLEVSRLAALGWAGGPASRWPQACSTRWPTTASSCAWAPPGSAEPEMQKFSRQDGADPFCPGETLRFPVTT